MIVNNARSKGLIALRSAGSKSIIDCVIIDAQNRSIKLIQAKSTKGESLDYIEPKLKEKLEKELKYLDGTYDVKFQAL